MKKLVKRSITFFILFTVTVVFVLGRGAREAAPAGKIEERPITLVGASQLPDTHVFWKTLVFFRDRVKELYRGPLEINLHHSGALGTEKDYVEFMIQGVSVDVAVAAPSWAATWDRRVSLLDPPFLYRDMDHWERVLSTGEPFKPIQRDLLQRGLRILGYGGGGTRNLILRRPIANMQDASNILLRVMAAPIQSRIFNAAGMRPVPLDFLETYNAIKTGVVDGLENESSALRSMKFYEVAPHIILTRHVITVRPLFFSEKTFQTLPKALQDAILKAGTEAAAFHRQTETRMDAEALKEMEARGVLRTYPFDTAEMQRRSIPVLLEFAREVGGEDIVRAVWAVK